MTIHDDEGHPHVHVVIRGYNEGGKQVGLYPKHLKITILRTRRNCKNS